jgi:23S rRNA (uridine2552-2'-O)-methyltransferase
VARTAVSQSGKVIGVDIEKVAQLEGTTILQGDIENADTIDLLMQTLNGKANTILSDISPKISGIWDIDHSKQISLSKSSMNIATETLVRGGNAVLKVFEGEFLNGFNKEVKAYFNKVLMTKPEASRQQSSELYMVCLGFRSNE